MKSKRLGFSNEKTRKKCNLQLHFGRRILHLGQKKQWAGRSSEPDRSMKFDIGSLIYNIHSQIYREYAAREQN